MSFDGSLISTVVDLSDNATVVSDGPAILYSVEVTVVTTAQAVLFQSGATPVTQASLDASSAVGTHKDFGTHGIVFSSDLTVNPDDAATGTVVVTWRRRSA